ncbi:MAG: hypothetical protein IKJ77_05740 [Firmicutes bacterium]|nr:hypothetical protein [Bacillota bacterium]
MEKRIGTVSALCFLMITGIAVAGVLIENETVRRVVVLAGCLVVVWLTTLNFKYLKLMKQMTEDTAPEVPDLVHWLQGETWPEIMGREKVRAQFPAELDAFLQTHPSCDASAIKGYRVWRTEETEKYFDWTDGSQQQILVLMDESGRYFQVFGSETLQKAMEEHAK